MHVVRAAGGVGIESFHDGAALQEHDARREAAREGEVAGGEQDRAVAFAEAAQIHHESVDIGGSEIAGGVVDQQSRRVREPRER